MPTSNSSQPPRPVRAWAVQWRQRDACGRLIAHLVWPELAYLPLFRTRRECLAYIRQRYAFVRDRADLRAPPHRWLTPRPVRVTVAIA